MKLFIALILFSSILINFMTDDGWQNTLEINGTDLNATFIGQNWTTLDNNLTTIEMPLNSVVIDVSKIS